MSAQLQEEKKQYEEQVRLKFETYMRNTTDVLDTA